jgi:hypothetical protein
MHERLALSFDARRRAIELFRQFDHDHAAKVINGFFIEYFSGAAQCK